MNPNRVLSMPLHPAPVFPVARTAPATPSDEFISSEKFAPSQERARAREFVLSRNIVTSQEFTLARGILARLAHARAGALFRSTFRTTVLTGTAILVSSAAFLGCGGQDEVEERLDIRVSIAPTPPIVGPARILVTITDPVLGPLEAGEVWIEGNPAHSGGRSAEEAAAGPMERVAAERLGDGMFAVPAFPFTTPGDWILEISVHAGGVDDQEQTARHEVRVVGGGPPGGG